MGYLFHCIHRLHARGHYHWTAFLCCLSDVRKIIGVTRSDFEERHSKIMKKVNSFLKRKVYTVTFYV